VIGWPRLLRNNSRGFPSSTMLRNRAETVGYTTPYTIQEDGFTSSRQNDDSICGSFLYEKTIVPVGCCSVTLFVYQDGLDAPNQTSRPDPVLRFCVTLGYAIMVGHTETFRPQLPLATSNKRVLRP
jgi:hypothetical protein